MAEETDLVDYPEIMIGGQQMAQDVLWRDVHVVEHYRSSVGTAPTELVLVLADDEAGNHLRNAPTGVASPSVTRGPRHREVILRRALRGKNLQAVEPIALAVRG